MEKVELFNRLNEELKNVESQQSKIENLINFTYDVSNYCEKDAKNRIFSALIEKIISELHVISHDIKTHIDSIMAERFEVSEQIKNMEDELQAMERARMSREMNEDI